MFSIHIKERRGELLIHRPAPGETVISARFPLFLDRRYNRLVAC